MDLIAIIKSAGEYSVYTFIAGTFVFLVVIVAKFMLQFFGKKTKQDMEINKLKIEKELEREDGTIKFFQEQLTNTVITFKEISGNCEKTIANLTDNHKAEIQAIMQGHNKDSEERKLEIEKMLNLNQQMVIQQSNTANGVAEIRTEIKMANNDLRDLKKDNIEFKRAIAEANNNVANISRDVDTIKDNIKDLVNGKSQPHARRQSDPNC